MSIRISVTITLLCSTFVAACTPEVRKVDNPDIAHAGHRIDTGVPVEIRDRISNDTAVVQLYADLLEGRAVSSMGWDTATVIWWLAESGNPKYMPIFLRFAQPNQPLAEYQMASYGLARRANLPAAQQRIRELTLGADPFHRSLMALILMHVNDDAARAILRQIAADGMPSFPSERERLLATPPLTSGEGRWPCPDGQELRKVPDGVFRCDVSGTRLRSWGSP